MTTLNVDLGDRSYPILIDRELIASVGLLKQYIPARQVMVVSNETVAPLYLDKLLSTLTDFEVHTHILPDGEEFKNLQILDGIFESHAALLLPPSRAPRASPRPCRSGSTRNTP